MELRHQPRSNFLGFWRQYTAVIKSNYLYLVHGITTKANLPPKLSTSKCLQEAPCYKNQTRSNHTIRMLLTPLFNSLRTWSAFVVTTCCNISCKIWPSKQLNETTLNNNFLNILLINLPPNKWKKQKLIMPLGCWKEELTAF